MVRIAKIFGYTLLFLVISIVGGKIDDRQERIDLSNKFKKLVDLKTVPAEGKYCYEITSTTIITIKDGEIIHIHPAEHHDAKKIKCN